MGNKQPTVIQLILPPRPTYVVPRKVKYTAIACVRLPNGVVEKRPFVAPEMR